MAQQNMEQGADQKKAGTQTDQDQIGRRHPTGPADKSSSNRPDDPKRSAGGDNSSDPATHARERGDTQSTDDDTDDERDQRLSDGDHQIGRGKGSDDRDREGG